jgi:hypothetical protein
MYLTTTAKIKLKYVRKATGQVISSSSDMIEGSEKG